ncbi:metallophosphoesterase [Halalkalicoccus sp. NIPERK01]|uniref:metallophosphoesterase n=1 Tax=Halalkalicoccus sp. NIPERK01 TaxID=3053469 RepID=UPI00256F595A|nr:metallophosphoesterase [Halalkalicoccus sp. NIPERK01]
MFEECVLRDRAVYLPGERALVLADVHLGRDRASNVEFPLGEREDLLSRLDALLSGFEPREVVVAGDLLHSFDRLPHGVERSLRAFERRIEDAGARLVVTRGNHDTMLDSVLEGTVADHRVGETTVCHGHERPDPAAGYVLGHVHPAITIEGRKRPCYLRGPATGGTEALVLPAFTRLAGGVDVSRARALRSPLLGAPGTYRPIVRDEDGDETLEFPPLGRFRAHL